MADGINLFDARRSDWTIPGTGKLTTEAQLFLREVWRRGGGSLAPTNNDLAASQFEDAGIEEIRAMVFALGDAGAQTPPIVAMQQQIESLESLSHQLAASLAELSKEVAGMKEAP